MDILNIEEVIFNLTSLMNYRQLVHLTSINKTYYGIANQMIKNYDNKDIMKELNIIVTLINYKARISEPTDIEKFTYGHSNIIIRGKSLIISCHSEIEIKSLMEEFSDHLRIKVSKPAKVQTHIKFNVVMTQEKYNQLKETPSLFKNQKLIIINNIKFKISKNGFVTSGLKNFNTFMVAYKILISMLK